MTIVALKVINIATESMKILQNNRRNLGKHNEDQYFELRFLNFIFCYPTVAHRVISIIDYRTIIDEKSAKKTVKDLRL